MSRVTDVNRPTPGMALRDYLNREENRGFVHAIESTPKAQRTYENFCEQFRECWNYLKRLLKEGDKAISDWDLDLFLYSDDEDETMCDHYEYGMPAWRQYYSSRSNMPLPRNHVIYHLKLLHVAKAYFKLNQPQMTLF